MITSALTRHRRGVVVVLGAASALLYVLWTAKHLGADIDQYADQQYFVNNLHGFVGNERFPFVQFGASDANIETTYGYTFQAIAFFVSWALASIRNEGFDPFAASTYTDKNVMVATLSLVALWAVFHATRSLTGRRRFAWAAVGALLLSPVFTGHALMNQKDVPLAVGFTALTAGTIACIARVQRRDTLDRAALEARFGSTRSLGWLLALGVAFTIGTRPASVLVVALDVALIAVVVGRARVHRQRPLLRTPVVGLAVGAAAVLATNSAAWPNPVSWLWHAIDVSRGFPNWHGKLLVDGVFHSSDAQPRWYLPFMLAVQTPVAIAVLAVFGVWYLALRATASSHRRSSTLLWAPLLVQLLVLPFAGVVQGSLFYNAARQVLFVLPMLAVLAAVGLLALDELTRGVRWRTAVLAVVCVGAASPLIDTLTLYPYQYVYFNELQRTADLTDRFEFDYWGISAREAQQWINERHPTAIEVYPIGWQFPPFAVPGITFASDWEDAGERDRIFATNYYPSWDIDRYRTCPVVHEVTRRLWGSTILLSYVRQCAGS